MKNLLLPFFPDLQTLSYGQTTQVLEGRQDGNETFISDEKGNKIILGVSAPASSNKDTGPYEYLCGDNKIPMSDLNFNKTIDANNEFINVIFSGKTYTIDERNKQFTSLDPHDYKVNTTVDCGQYPCLIDTSR